MGLVLRRRIRKERPNQFTAHDREFEELLDLALALNGIELVPPQGFADELARRLADAQE